MSWTYRIAVMLCMILPIGVVAQNVKPRLFIDCRTNCDETYFRQEIPYVDHVRDIQLSDIHLLITSFGAGSGGETYKLLFTGRKDYAGNELELEYSAPPNSTRDDIRSGLLKKMNLGLIPFLMESDMIDKLEVTVALPQRSEADSSRQFDPFGPMQDPWKLWVFEASLNGNMNLESIRQRYRFRSRFEANRITDEWRIRQNFYYNRTKTVFKQEEEDDIVADLYSVGNWGQVVRSISDHWSVGVFNSIEADVFENIKLGTRFGPAIEYSLFPYNEVNYRELVFAYYIRHYYREYNEETVFGKLQEQLVDQSVRIGLRLRRPWGSVFTSLEGRHFFHDPQRNRVEFRNRISWRIFQGFAVDATTNFQLINDQLSLPRGEATLEELLLEQQQRSTNYEVFVGIGLSYTFGSIYNNIVNTRL